MKEDRRSMAYGVKNLAFAVAATIVVYGWAAPAAMAAAPASPVTGSAAPGGLLEAILFYAVAGLTVISAIGVCVTQSIVRMAVWLLLALCAVAVLYFLMAAVFIGAIQLIVYVGGTLVLLIFGVMLTSRSLRDRAAISKVEFAYAAVVCGWLVGVLIYLLTKGTVWSVEGGAVAGTDVASLGTSLMTTYVVPFEVAGVLLMIVMVGAAHMARQEK